MTAAEWWKKLSDTPFDKDTWKFVTATETDIQAILDDGRVQGMREAADLVSGSSDCVRAAIKIDLHADKLAKGEK